MRRGALLLFVPLVVAVAVVAGRGATSSGAEAEARRDTERRLDAFVPPPEAEQVDGFDGLEGSGERPITSNFVDSTRTWKTPESVSEVGRWLRAHPPHDSRLIETGGGSGYTDFGYVSGDLRGVARERWLRVSVLPDGEGAALRADSQAVWIEPRPTAERIPADVRILEVELTREGGRPERALVRGPRVGRIAESINGFGIVQPGESSCTQPGPQVWIALNFRRDRGSAAVAEARYPWPMSNCDDLELTLEGKRQPALEEAWVLHQEMGPILERVSR